MTVADPSMSGVREINVRCFNVDYKKNSLDLFTILIAENYDASAFIK